jgi:hypothetical protein
MKFSSVTSKLNLMNTIQVEKFCDVKTGDVILAEVLSQNPAYPYLEKIDGELSTLEIGDKIIGVLGARQALRGFVGYSPTKLNNNNQLSLLNMGGVIGCCVDSAVGLGDPPQLKYLGTVVDEQGVVNINRSALPHTTSILGSRQIILILGTCMNVGKTYNATKLISAATHAGYKVGAAKIAGVAAIKDLQCFKNAGAIDVKSFLDCGIPSTVDAEDLAPIVKNIINALKGDLLIIELGDGIMGHYKVETVLADKEIMSNITSIVVCAADLAATFGAKQYLGEFGIKIDIFSGPATDNISGSQYIEEKWGIPAINGYKFPDHLFQLVQSIWSNHHD